MTILPRALRDRAVQHPRRFFLLTVAASVALLLLASLLLLLVLIDRGAFGPAPDRAALLAYRNDYGSEIFDRHGSSLGRFYAQDRSPCRYADLSAHLVNALVVTEDSRFYDHSGIDWAAYGRVAYYSILRGEDEQGGGSTLSQQLIKNAYGRPALGYGRHADLLLHKLREARLARRLESIMSKEEVIERYLNTVSFPGNTFGIAAASRRYFQKEPAELTVRESASLIASLKGSTAYDPRRAPARNRERADRTLRLMTAAGYLTPNERSAALADDLCLNYYRESAYAGLAPHFTEAVRLRAAELAAAAGRNLYTDDLRVYTTLDLGQQAHAEAALTEGLADHQRDFERHLGNRNPWETDASLRAAVRSSARWRAGRRRGLDTVQLLEEFARPLAMELPVPNAAPRRGQFSPLDSVAHTLRYLRAGLLVLDNASGAVRAWVGGPDFVFSRYDHVLSRRQTGSTFKPIVYAAALRAGYSPCYTLNNEVRSYVNDDGSYWTPQNSGGDEGGRYSMHGALARSSNTAAVRMAVKVGPPAIIALARELGIGGELPEIAGLALGIAEGNLRDLVGAYTTFANGGYHSDPWYIDRIETAGGEIVYQHAAPPRRVLSEEEAAAVLEMLRRVVDHGTGGRLRWQYGVDWPAAGKTGTTQHMADGWFVGSTPALTAGVWVGGENPGVRFRSGHAGNGSQSALPIWAGFVRRMAADSAQATQLGKNFPVIPESVRASFYCPQYYPPEEEELLPVREGEQRVRPVEAVAREPG